jgi:thioredoxin-like negative regulator of GroEL
MKILKFFSKTCGPCKQMGKILAGLESVEIQEVDIAEDSNAGLIEQYGVKSIPTVVVVDGEGNAVKTFKGITPLAEIEEAIGGVV